MSPTNRFIFLLLSLVPLVFGQAPTDEISHGMDMNMDTDIQLASGQMLPYLHFSGQDILWFQGWVPQTKGAVVGACLGLFLLAIFDRWLSAMRSVAEVYWIKSAQIKLANKINTQGKGGKGRKSFPALTMRNIPPFVPANDIARGILFGAQALLTYTFMLAVMTFNAGFIIAIIVGLGVGEALFGRYIAPRSGLH